jgi:hypothetical protein
MAQVFIFYPIYRPEITRESVVDVSRRALESRGWTRLGEPDVRVERNPDVEWLSTAAPQRYVVIFGGEPPASNRG